MLKSDFFRALALIIISALTLASISFPSSSVAQTRQEFVAEGFEINRFADPTIVPEFAVAGQSGALAGPTALAFDARGRLFVGTLSGRILIMLDNNDDGRADEVKTFATGLGQVLGLEFRANGDLFATSNLIRGVGRIIRLRDLNGDDVADEKTIVIDNLPSDGDHQTNRLKFGPDGLLYVGQGSSTEDGEPESGSPPERPLNATILRVDVDNPASLGVFATGLRNPFGMAFHPENGQLFSVDVGSGELCQINCTGEDTSPLEEVNWIVQSGFYGFPGCEGMIDPSKPACAGARSAMIFINRHLTPTSIAFYTGPQAREARNRMLVTIYKRISGEGGELRWYNVTGSAATGFHATEVFPRLADFGIIDPFDGPIDTAIDPITGDIYVARFDPVTHADLSEHHHFIYRIHRAGSDQLPFIGNLRPSSVKAGSAATTISVTGRHLKSGAFIFNVTDNVALATRQGASAFELVADLPASAIQSERVIVLEARNPEGTPSNQLTFTVTRNDSEPPPLQTPRLNSLLVFKKKKKNIINPLTVGMSAKKLRLSVEGIDFDAGAQLLVNDTPLELLSASETELIGRITSAMVASPGELTVQVRNSNGKLSNTLKLIVSP
ncbi:MAG TPA: PQQ-dependent sugar dehydrogenase [Blastocatellia bacterium]|nr:PQQ-dependent sugar dehydrogenase [Blastocatellia bacterium]